jgi:hypothetical protein
MNSLVNTRGKEIIICLLIVILMLIILPFRVSNSNPKPTATDPITATDRITDANLRSFVNLLNDPNQNVHGVILPTNQLGKLIIFNNSLERIKPCFNSDEILKPGDKILIERECIKDNIKVEEEKTQIIALTPGTTMEGYGKPTSSKGDGTARVGHSTFLIITEPDKRQTTICHNPDGSHCPPRY